MVKEIILFSKLEISSKGQKIYRKGKDLIILKI
jgi:hypothetical protein